MSGALDTLIKQAAAARRESRFPDAKLHLAAAIDLLRETPSDSRLAPLLREMGEVERNLGHLESAREHYEQAVAIYRNGTQPVKLAHTIRHLGDVHCQAGSPRLAEPCYHEALALYRDHPEAPPLDLANAIRSMALLQEQMGATEQARLLWAEARDLYSTVRIKEGVAESERRLARLAG